MSHRDIRQEAKEMEGDPLVKGRRRELHKEWSQQTGLLDAVLQSNAVVRNPTHVSVAIRYAPDELELPMVVAKGVDELAFVIREIAEDGGVPTLEHPTLARALNEQIEVNQPISEEFFEAVAKVLHWAEQQAAEVEAEEDPAPAAQSQTEAA